MTPPTVEIGFFGSSKAYQDDPAKPLADFVEYLKTAKGLISNCRGSQDIAKAYSFVLGPRRTEWQSYEDHKVIMDSPTYQVDVIEKVLPALFSSNPPSLKTVHVQFDKDPTKPFEAPVTEVLVGTLKHESTDKKEEMKGCFAHLAGVLDGTAISATWGQAREDEGLFVIVVGWESIETHREAGKSTTEETSKVIASLLELATVTVNHTKLVKYI